MKAECSLVEPELFEFGFLLDLNQIKEYFTLIIGPNAPSKPFSNSPALEISFVDEHRFSPDQVSFSVALPSFFSLDPSRFSLPLCNLEPTRKSQETRCDFLNNFFHRMAQDFLKGSQNKEEIEKREENSEMEVKEDQKEESKEENDNDDDDDGSGGLLIPLIEGLRKIFGEKTTPSTDADSS